MMDRSQFNSMPCDGIVKGTCVILTDGEVIYAGPIKGAPDVSGNDVMMNPEDFERLKAHVEKRRH